MKSVQVLDRKFNLYLKEVEIKQRIKEVAQQINTDLEGKTPLFICILNGAFMFAADLYREITLPSEITFVKVASYQGTSSTGNVTKLLGLNESIEGRTVVIVEDIVDSGLSMQHILAYLKEKNPAEVRICAMLLKPGNLKVDLDIPYCCFKIPNDFIVGYGLDYDGQGRNLSDIYVVE
ncbi:hypoxanthine phosphoribosyltransferase [Pseudoprevotella muciniphila]|uniref:Hypoxanthine phosphoribosyltransferase n=1 Tax=Pseudoprevotella muciniphila TaxID=2133944 RepID=A0A5P8E3N1_9BACT|nr:hypoxanthine phosphoribosyltransferase [Pseudoprevotella muciniphila]QFQ11627.1 hypoxanthine phosphoribosyltransferase [Pseudoprevotella muciniphila]